MFIQYLRTLHHGCVLLSLGLYSVHALQHVCAVLYPDLDEQRLPGMDLRDYASMLGA